ncbi:uncharacterized protein LOC144714848 [Wolffia australiana]
MEGLIKGLIDVALGGGGDDQQPHRRRGNDEQGDGSRQNEQPRSSSWADVVSSQSQEQGNDYKPSNLARPQHVEESSDGEWQVAGDNRHNRRQPRHGRMVPIEEWSGFKVPPSQQEYSSHVEDGIDVEPTAEELGDLSMACNRLWALDLNGLVPGKDFMINLGEGKRVYQKGDAASESLFSWVKEDIFQRPTYSRFCSLLDNYEPSQRTKEVVTEEEKYEQDGFIEEISRTAPVQYLFRLLSLKGAVQGDYEEFKKLLKSLWFDLYGRGGVCGSSSAFEHVFVGEIKEQSEAQVSGFHNWIQFYLEEAKGRVNYHGYIFPRNRCEVPDEESKLLTIQFEWNGVLKAVSSTLVGVSPEFELALYTLCFFLGGEDNHVNLGPHDVNVKCYRHQGQLGSVFPIAE